MEAARSASARCHSQSDDFNVASDDDDCPDGEGAAILSEPPEDVSASACAPAGLKGSPRTLLTGPFRDVFERLLRLWQSIVDKLSWLRAVDFDSLQHFDSPDIGDRENGQRGSIIDPLRDILSSSWLNVLLVFVPVGLASYAARGSPVLIFASNAIAIVPLSAILTDATERIAAHAGDTVGALLNISLGNLVELILFIVALANNHVRIVQASILGSVLVNLLLILGSALLAGSLVNGEPTYNTAEAQLLACLLFVSVFAFLMPTAFDYTYDPAKGTGASSLKLSRISSLLVLAIYIVYFVHELRSHSPHDGDAVSSREFDLESNTSGLDQHQPPPPPPLPHPRTGSQTLQPRTIRFADENPGGSASHKPGNRIDSGAMNSMESDEYGGEHRGRRSGDSDSNRSRPNWHQPLWPRKHSRSLSLTSSRGRLSRESSLSREMTRGFSRSSLTTLQLLRENRLDREQSVDRQSADPGAFAEIVASLGVLIVASGLMSVSAELLVSAIDDVTHQTDLSESVIGLIILPIVGNIAEYVTVVAAAARDKMGLAIAVAVGSSIQIALCVTPLTVIAGWIMHRDLALTFNFFELATLLGGVLLVNLLILNESSSSLRTSGLKGALMCTCYVIIGLGAYFAPETKE